MLGLRNILFLGVVASAASCGAPKYKHPEKIAMMPRHSFGAVWDDPMRCSEVVAAGRRMRRPKHAFRVGTWNIRWFPDGRPGTAPNVPTGGTHVEWLGCIIAYLNVDLLGMQEVKLTPRGVEALQKLMAELERYTEVPWKYETDTCGDPSRQHVIFMYRTDRVEVSGIQSHAVIDPTRKDGAEPNDCGMLRPALGAYIKSKGGGLDFHFATTHLDSGRKERDFTNRRKAWKLIGDVHSERMSERADDDFVIAADFNIMGAPSEGVKTSAAELELLAGALSQLRRPLKVPTPEPMCTEYYNGKAYVLDAITYSEDMAEAAGVGVQVAGVCGAAKCATIEATELPAFVRLSDHCPVLIDLKDEDMD